MFLAGDPDGAGTSLYSMEVERRIPHRLSSGLDRYTSLAASADGKTAKNVYLPNRKKDTKGKDKDKKDNK